MIEKRLYIVVPKFVNVPDTKGIVYMPCGRLIAQAVHVGSKIKQQERLDPELETTTIILQVSDSSELERVLEKVKKAHVPWQVFLDTNPEVYQTENSLLTAVACLASRKKGKSIFYGIDSWSCDR